MDSKVKSVGSSVLVIEYNLVVISIEDLAKHAVPTATPLRVGLMNRSKGSEIVIDSPQHYIFALLYKMNSEKAGWMSRLSPT